jgi:hypothetical protein
MWQLFVDCNNNMATMRSSSLALFFDTINNSALELET